MYNEFWNVDCVIGSRNHIEDNSVGLLIADPPFGIDGGKLKKHYNRKDSLVLEEYNEVTKERYPAFSELWIQEAERVLRPGGSLYIISGYTNLRHILNALEKTNLIEVNHIIWEYAFGVYTSKKYVSSHYHILYYVKPPTSDVTFNTLCRAYTTKGSYSDRIDVWRINRDYKPGQVKTKNSLPIELIKKIIQYSSNKDDMVCDFFLGGFTTAIASHFLERRCCGFEINPVIFEHGMDKLERVVTRGEGG